MEVLLIPKEKVLELIKKDYCSCFDSYNYNGMNAELVFDSYSRFEENKLYITYKDLASLLFDGSCSFEGCGLSIF